MTTCNTEGYITGPDGTELYYDGLPNSNFKLLFPKLPYMVMFLQGFDLPGINVNQARRPTPYVDTNEIGEKINYSPFTCSFLVDKKLKNVKEVYNWIKRMTVAGTVVGETDNPVLMINNVEMVRFVDAWPMGISGFSFEANATDVIYLKCQATFNYDYLEFI